MNFTALITLTVLGFIHAIHALPVAAEAGNGPTAVIVADQTDAAHNTTMVNSQAITTAEVSDNPRTNWFWLGEDESDTEKLISNTTPSATPVVKVRKTAGVEGDCPLWPWAVCGSTSISTTATTTSAAATVRVTNAVLDTCPQWPWAICGTTSISTTAASVPTVTISGTSTKCPNGAKDCEDDPAEDQ